MEDFWPVPPPMPPDLPLLLMKLTDVKIRNLTTPGKHADGSGLYLEISPKGSKYWRLKYRFAGVEKRLAFGVYPDVSLKVARERRDDARQLLGKGIDPGVERKASKTRARQEAASTVEALAREWLSHQAGRWAEITLSRIRNSLEADLFTQVGRRPIVSITPRDVITVVQRIEKRGAGEIAARMFQRIKAIFRFAVVHHWLELNPISEMQASDVLRPRKVIHRPALSDRELPEFLAALSAYEGDPHTVGAIRLLMLTAVRPGELRGARWVEVNMAEGKWRIPAERMKMNAEHLVPLSRQAMLEIKKMEPLSGNNDLIFPSPFYPSKALSENTINSALARMGYKGEATAHGMRSLFSTIANEAGWNSDAIERQLAHTERNQVRAAYNRSTYLPERTEMMQWWADYLDNVAQNATINTGSKKKHLILALKKAFNTDFKAFFNIYFFI